MYSTRNRTANVIVGAALLWAAAAAAATAAATSAPANALVVAPPSALCATTAQASAVAATYAKTPAPPTFAAAAMLKIPEAVVASALPPTIAIGVAGDQFRAVWESMSEWDSAVALIMKGGDVFEISTKIVKGTPSKTSKFYNLGNAALSGHLRPDLISVLYAVQIAGKEGAMRGVMFYDGNGDNVFGVFARGAAEGKDPSTQQLAQFEATWNLIKSLPRACPGPAAG